MNTFRHFHYNSDDVKQKKTEGDIYISKKQLLIAVGCIAFFVVYGAVNYYIFIGSKTKSIAYSPSSPTFSKKRIPSSKIKSTSETLSINKTTSPTPVTDDTESWKTYENPMYKIKFKYPESYTLSFNKTAASTSAAASSSANFDPYLMQLTAVDPENKGKFTINVQDIQFIGQSELETRAVMRMSLADFAARKWTLNQDYIDDNVPNRRIGTLETMTFLGVPAYAFTLSGSWKDDREYILLVQKYEFIFTEHNTYKMIISYPMSDAVLKKVLDTVEFF